MGGSGARAPRGAFPSAEYALLHKLEPLLNSGERGAYVVGVGDDAAVRTCRGSEKLVLTADAQIEGVHFSLDTMTFRETGYRAMAVNLSDCAAMGAAPDGALVQLILPRGGRGLDRCVVEIYRGFSRACRRWRFPIIGGDLSSGPSWVIAVTLIGRMSGGARVLRRTGARDGDGLWATGHPGASAAGRAAMALWRKRPFPRWCVPLTRAHIRPEPRLATGVRLSATSAVHAAIDVSDGISKECHTLAFDNKLGIIIERSALRCSPPMKRLADLLAVDWLEWFLHGGEDYELLYAAAPGFDPDQSGCGTEVRSTRIGRFTRNVRGVYLEDRGRLTKVPRKGWDHLRNALREEGIGF